MTVLTIEGWYLYWNVWYLFRGGRLFGWASAFPGPNLEGLFPGQYCCDPGGSLTAFAVETLALARSEVQLNARWSIRAADIDDHGFARKLKAELLANPREADLSEELASVEVEARL